MLGRAAQERLGSLTRAIIDDAYEVTISYGSFPVIYLNPPYDVDPTDFENRRAEYKALQYFWKYLQPDGMMLWVAYAHHMSRSVGASFARNCRNFQVYRMPEPHLDRYTQILVIGRRHNDKDGHIANDIQVEQIAEKFAALGTTPAKVKDISFGVPKPKDAPEDFDSRYELPRQREVRQFTFFPRHIDTNVLLELHQHYGAHKLPAFAEAIKKPEPEALIRPVAPPRIGQLAVVMASGMLNGVPVIHNEKNSIIRGSVKRMSVEVHSETTEDENGNQVITETFHDIPQPQIVVLSEDGTVDNITEDEKLIDFIDQHREELMGYFTDTFKPKYDMTIDPLWGETYDVHKVNGNSDLLPTQEYVTTAATEHLALNPGLIIVGEPSVGKTAAAIGTIANLVKLEKAKRENPAALDSIRQRYGAKLRDLKGIKPGQVVFIVCPAIMPEKWQAEIESMYPQAVVHRVNDVLSAKKLFEDADKDAQNGSGRLHIGISSYENIKLAEAWESQYQLQTKYGKVIETDKETGLNHTVIRAMPVPIDPITSGPIRDRIKGEWQAMDLTRLEGRQWFYQGKVFDGYERVDDPLHEGRTKLVRVHKRWPERMDRENLTELAVPANGFALFSDKRSLGLPKEGNNGRVAYEDVTTVIPAQNREYWGPVKDAETGDKSWAKIGYITKEREATRRKIVKNLWPNEPVVDEWVALHGIRCFDSSNRRSALERAIREAGLSFYQCGNGNKKLDELLDKAELQYYYAGDGKRVLRNPRYPIGAYIARRYPKRIALLIVDELHRAKGMDTDQGTFVRALAYTSEHILGLTGTLYGGVSSSIFALEFVFNERVRRRFPWVRGTPMHWIKQMGVLEDVYEQRAEYFENGQLAGVKRHPKVRGKEVPGASPEMVRELMDHALFVGLKDLGAAMPEFEEIPVAVEMGGVQKQVYNECYSFLKKYNAECIVRGDKSFVGAFYQNMLHLPDSMFRENDVHHRKVINPEARHKDFDDQIIFTTPSIGLEIQPKEAKLAELVNQIIERGERVIVFVSQTNTRDIQPRIQDGVIKALCEKAKPFTLYSDTVKTEQRGSYIRKMVEDKGHNVMICNPKLVAEGVDLIQFNNIIYLEIEPSLLVMGQSSRRTWRINQPLPECTVYYLYYEDVYQRASVQAIAEKTAAANTLYGNEGGSLSAMSHNVGDMFAMIAELVKTGVRTTADELKAKFKRASYTDADFIASSWYAEPRKKNIIVHMPDSTPEGDHRIEIGLELEYQHRYDPLADLEEFAL